MTRSLRTIAIVLSLFLTHTASLSAADNADQLVTRVAGVLQKVRDYTAEVVVTPDVPMLKMQPVTGTVYYKAPNSFSIVSPNLAILPKQGLMEHQRILQQRDQFSAVQTGTETIGGVSCSIISLLPHSDTMDIILAKLWIDPSSALVYKALVTTRNNGTITVDYHYGSQKAYALPDQIVFYVDVKKFKFSKGVSTDINHSKSTPDGNGPKSGSIRIDLSHYKVNSGLGDDVFRKH